MSDLFSDKTVASVGKAFQRVSIAGPAHSKRKAPPPFSLRLTAEERSRLEQDAGSTPLGAYIRSRLFDGSSPVRRGHARRPVKDQEALARLLGAFGQSRIANNLNQLAKAANSGSFLLTLEGEATLHEACDAVKAMRALLMDALGLDGGQRS